MKDDIIENNFEALFLHWFIYIIYILEIYILDIYIVEFCILPFDFFHYVDLSNGFRLNFSLLSIYNFDFINVTILSNS